VEVISTVSLIFKIDTFFVTKLLSVQAPTDRVTNPLKMGSQAVVRQPLDR